MKPYNEWRPVVGYETHYEVSSNGDVRSIDRVDSSGKQRHGHVLSKAKTTNGYEFVWLCKNNKRKSATVHRLVATAFIHNQANKLCVNHINGIRDDNRASNLEWVTHSENNKDGYARGRKHPMLGVKGKQNKLSKPIKAIPVKPGFSIKKFDSIGSVADHGFTRSGVYQSLVGKISQHKGYRWEYA